jgi:four helix bundle protein
MAQSIFAEGKNTQSNRNSRIEIRLRSIFDFRFSKIMAFLFEKLDVYKKAIAFANVVSELTGNFPKGNYYLVDQFNRAALSISTNIAEGNGRFHRADRINFFRIARGSAFECIPIVELCGLKSFINDLQKEDLRNQLEDISKMLSGLIG